LKKRSIEAKKGYSVRIRKFIQSNIGICLWHLVIGCSVVRLKILKRL